MQSVVAIATIFTFHAWAGPCRWQRDLTRSSRWAYGQAVTAPLQSVMMEQAFTLAMGGLRLDVGHEEQSAKELLNLAYEHESSSLVPIIERFSDPDEAAAESSLSEGEGVPLAASSQVGANDPAEDSSESPPGNEESTGTADPGQEGSSEKASDPVAQPQSEP
eukprot:6088834-Pleurochrysis_carterae.AAC.2